MNKLLLILAGVLCSLSAAADYGYLEFSTTDGTTFSVGTSGLLIIPASGNLNVSNAEGQTLSIPLTSLVDMQFTGSDDAKVGLTKMAPGEITVYELNGLQAGTFPSFGEASKVLKKGLYVIKNRNGENIKVLIEK